MPPSYLMQSLCWPIECFLCLNFHSQKGHCPPTTKIKKHVSNLKDYWMTELHTGVCRAILGELIESF